MAQKFVGVLSEAEGSQASTGCIKTPTPPSSAILFLVRAMPPRHSDRGQPPQRHRPGAAR